MMNRLFSLSYIHILEKDHTRQGASFDSRSS